MSRVFDVFLCHSGRGEARVKELLDFVRSMLNELPALGGCRPVCAFRDEDDLDRMGTTQDALIQALHQAPIGVHSRPEAPHIRKVASWARRGAVLVNNHPVSWPSI